MITLTAKIYISETEIIEINRRNMLEINCSICSRSDLELPSWGIISNVGSIRFNDSDGKVLEYAENLRLQEGLKCEIWLNNTLVDGANEILCEMETNKWDYDNNNRAVIVSIKDDLEELQSINFDEISYDPRSKVRQPFSWLYKVLWLKTSNRKVGANQGRGNYNMLHFDELDLETKNVLSNTFIEYPLLSKGTLWQQWTKLCEVCQLYIYKRSDGVVDCRYKGGS